MSVLYEQYISFTQAHFTITGVGDTMNYSNNYGHSPYDGSPGSCVPVVLSLSIQGMGHGEDVQLNLPLDVTGAQGELGTSSMYLFKPPDFPPNSWSGQAGVTGGTFNPGFGLQFVAPPLTAWDLTSPIGPLDTGISSMSSFFALFTFTDKNWYRDLWYVQLTPTSSVTFTADVPEPASPWLFAAGVLTLALPRVLRRLARG